MAPDATEALLDKYIETVANHALGWYGYLNQLEKAEEECREFGVSLSCYKGTLIGTSKVDNACKNDLIDETADILFMAYQVAKIVGIKEVKERLDYKAERLLCRINDEIIDRQKLREKEKE